MPSNPKQFLNKVFPTNRRLLVNYSLASINKANTKWNKVLVVGAGNDPYRNLFGKLEQYIRLDILIDKDKVDVVAAAHFLPFGDESFDCILAIEVMEHLEYPKSFIDEVYRVLEKDGSFYATIPFMFHEHGDPSDYWRPTRFALEILYNEFKKVKIAPQGNRFHVILDLISTSRFLFRVFRFLRIFNHIACLVNSKSSNSSSPSGYFISAKK